LKRLQAAFSAINVEPEDNVDEEYDTTKEVQVRWPNFLMHLD
jgi:hypothetical protein